MDRKQQLGNVSFGGAWSEQIADDEALALAMARLDGAVIDTMNDDLRGDPELEGALARTAAAHPKGPMLAKAWSKALAMPNPGLRSAELQRIATALRAGIGVRLPGR
ncbi:hypothetical protein pthi1_p51 [Paracoccus phage vB_PthS_Pthi1]|uniref:Uncharacterized protein n=1 Tax=Paracoccus thiocyanatus TaxID=34006 RepID=A0A1N6SDS9_9RHOB|nr:hypothetical protein [Paracoccus thiocyanatus]AZV00416.1 hypothetical protein pthi1_p51 [Paracoccus phage vB_PthS_Pthi1]RDW14446.1 hypothetical protein DIE28_02775 [Paracoccus thiocyanatus]SIQ39231.1 hypothetical protein SAMN05421641_10772 [Paracoccus thiocyanatus]